MAPRHTEPGYTAWSIVPSMGRSFLSLAKSEDGVLVVTGLRIEAEASTVAMGNYRVALRHSSIILRDVLVPRSARGEYVVGVGDAKFLATLFFDGDSRLIDLVNAEPIVFRENAIGGWEFDPFDTTYTDLDSSTWTVRLDRILFSPDA
jgi:hypothetical protein